MTCSGTSFLLADIDDVWSTFEARALRKLPTEEVLGAVAEARAGEALTLIGPDGLLILSLTSRGDELELAVLLAVSTGAPGAFDRQEAAVCAIARDLGASAVVFIPERKGWKRLLGPDWITRGKAHVRYLHVEQIKRGTGDATAGSDGREGPSTTR